MKLRKNLQRPSCPDSQAHTTEAVTTEGIETSKRVVNNADVKVKEKVP